MLQEIFMCCVLYVRIRMNAVYGIIAKPCKVTNVSKYFPFQFVIILLCVLFVCCNFGYFWNFYVIFSIFVYKTKTFYWNLGKWIMTDFIFGLTWRPISIHIYYIHTQPIQPIWNIKSWKETICMYKTCVIQIVNNPAALYAKWNLSLQANSLYILYIPKYIWISNDRWIFAYLFWSYWMFVRKSINKNCFIERILIKTDRKSKKANFQQYQYINQFRFIIISLLMWYLYRSPHFTVSHVFKYDQLF